MLESRSLLHRAKGIRIYCSEPLLVFDVLLPLAQGVVIRHIELIEALLTLHLLLLPFVLVLLQLTLDLCGVFHWLFRAWLESVPSFSQLLFAVGVLVALLLLQGLQRDLLRHILYHRHLLFQLVDHGHDPLLIGTVPIDLAQLL